MRAPLVRLRPRRTANLWDEECPRLCQQRTPRLTIENPSVRSGVLAHGIRLYPLVFSKDRGSNHRIIGNLVIITNSW